MNGVFGGSFQLIDDTTLPVESWMSPEDYAEWARQQLSGLRLGDKGIFRLRRPKPTAAFSPQDTTHPAYEKIKQLTRARGFSPVERGTGGRLTLYDENALAITIIAPHHAPHEYTLRRYDVLCAGMVKALESLGIDCRIGELANEYCPGKYSVNAEGRVKLIGVAQRMNKACFQMGAIVSVTRSGPALAGLKEAYSEMGLVFDPNTYGAISDFNSALTYGDVRDALCEEVGKILGL